MNTRNSVQPVLRTVFCTEAENPDLIRSILAFRKRVLVDEQGWKLRVIGDIERDEFDTSHAVHCAILLQGRIAACFRLIRADQPYLAKTVFPQLATLRPFPSHANAWELSRLAVEDSARSSGIMLYAYSAAFYFARSFGASSLIAFAEVAKERLVRRIGISTRLLGEPTSIGCDAHGRPMVVVAGELPLAQQSGARAQKLMSLVEETEICDAAAVLGRARLSA